MTVCATVGAFATSAINDMYGELIWNPITVLEFLLDRNYNASSRAGCFFAGMGFFISQIATNLVQNSVSCGMDLAALAPRWIDVTRGSLIMVSYCNRPLEHLLTYFSSSVLLVSLSTLGDMSTLLGHSSLF